MRTRIVKPQWIMPAAALALLIGSVSAFAQTPVDRDTIRLPKEARAPVPDVSSQPPLRPDRPGRDEHTGRVVRVDADRIILIDRIGLERVIPVNSSTKVWRINTATYLEDIKKGERVKTSAPKGEAAETVAIVEDE